MNLPRKCPGVLALAGLTALAACNSATTDWNKATAQNTEASYQNFLTAHPKDPHAADARNLMSTLQDDRAWSVASTSGTKDAYSQYLNEWPSGAHSQDARNAVSVAAESADWKAAQGAGSVSAIQQFLAEYPNGADAGEAKAKLAELSGFRAQLASEPNEARAKKKLVEYKRRFSATVPNLNVIAPPNAGGKYAIASTGMSESQAQGICNSLKSAHQSCEVVDKNGST